MSSFKTLYFREFVLIKLNLLFPAKDPDAIFAQKVNVEDSEVGLVFEEDGRVAEGDEVTLHLRLLRLQVAYGLLLHATNHLHFLGLEHAVENGGGGDHVSLKGADVGS